MRRHVFLYLALACFLGIIAIFVFDGYLGVYDTVYVTTGEHEQEISPEFAQRGENFWPAGATWGDKTFFRYQVDNRRFTSYSGSIQASLWKENEKILDLLTVDTVIEPFATVTETWSLDSKELEAMGFEVSQYTLKVERDGSELSILIHYSYPPQPPEKVEVR